MNCIVRAMLLTVVFCGMFSTLDAEIYIWTDENGIKHYSNTQPAETTADVKEQAEIVVNEKKSKTTSNAKNNYKSAERNSVDNLAFCEKKLDACKDHRNKIYEAKAKTCEGDWSAVSALNKMTGKKLSPKKLMEECKEEFREEREKTLKACERKYNKCRQQ